MVKAVLNHEMTYYLFLDMRRFENKDYIIYPDFLKVLEREINSKTRSNNLISYLKKIKGIKIMGFSVTFNWGKERVDFSDILSGLDEWAQENSRVIIVIDEAQELIKLKGYNIIPSISYAYDNLKNLTFIITGSELRIKSKFLKLDDENSPLYGRVNIEIDIPPFNSNQAIDFLRKGFEEQGINFSKANEVYEYLGGNPGWLTYYGYVYTKLGERNAVEKTKMYAKRLLTREFCNFLKEGNRLPSMKRYIKTIDTCQKGCTWKDVKNALEALEGREINDSIVYTILRNLIEYSFLVSKGDGYIISDKLLGEITKGFRCQ